ncbi:MAG TPA: PQQ-binding-like beta-propeller repeat protein [Rhizomicrobium sp.]|jgi:outer membrane protein assembly factor BamB|nr:PQQ-binding-like beta-propeller repeat protein [Rhizomicrobium sp.]
MMAPSRKLRALAALSALLLLGGCAVFDTIGGWFSSNGKKSNLKGVRISVMSLDETLRPDPALANIPIKLPPPYRNPAWPEPGGYPSNAMYHLEANGQLRQVWDADAGKGSDTASRLTAPPVVADGMVFALDSEAHIYVFRSSDGSPVWNRRLAPKNGTDFPTLWGLLGKPNTIDTTTGMGGGVAYNAGKIFVTSGFGVVIAMDARNGRELWRHDLGIPIINAPVVDGGRLFVSTDDNHFYCLAESDGRQLWDHQGITESAGILTSTSAAVSGEFVVVPYTSGEVYALRVQNGQPAWSDVLSHSGRVTALSELDDIAGRPVIDRNVVFAISQSGVMAAINLPSGERLWSRDIGGIQTPWAAGDYVYVLDNQNRLICLTRQEGKVRWIHQLPQWDDPDNKSGPLTWAGPVLVSNKLIVTSSNGYAEAVSPYTGRLTGRVEIPAGTVIAPVVANDTLYLYTSDADLVALR